MGSNPANLAVRFLLELGVLVALGWWGWSTGTGAFRLLLAIVLPAAASLAWGVFNVPGDPSRSGAAPVPVPGVVRLALEFVLFGAAIAAWFDVGATVAGVIFAVVAALHYLVSYDRVKWLVTSRAME